MKSRVCGRILLSLLFSAISLNTIYSQLTEVEDISGGKFLREEIHVTTDRDLYFPGEKIQLRIDLLNLLSGAPSETSKVVYVELIDGSGNPSVQIKAGMQGSTGSAELLIPDTLRTGSYIVRSSTAWMQNFSAGLFSHKMISVINPFEIPASRKLPEALPRPDSVLFFPESGSLVAGLESVVGLRCFSRRGNPVSIRGFITNEKNDTLAEVETGRNGYGLFSILPEASGRLYLLLKNTPGSGRIPLPAVKNRGVAFSLVSSDNENFIISTGFSRDPEDRDRNFLNYAPVSLPPIRKEIIPSKGCEISLAKKDLPTGPAYLSITGSNGEILAGRWVINDPGDPAYFSVRTGQEEYFPREKVSMEITAHDASGNPVSANFSVSVVKSVLVNTEYPSFQSRGSQTASLSVMDTDLSGDIDDINDYLMFVTTSASEASALLSSSGAGFRFPEMEGHLVSGTVRNTSDGAPLANEKIVMSYVGKSAQCRFTESDEKGQFNFVIRDYGKKEIVIQPLSAGRDNYYVEIMNPFPGIRKKYNIPEFNIDSNRLEEINRAVISMQVKSIYEPFTRADISQTEYAPDFYGRPDLSIRLEDYIRLTTFREVIKEILPGVSTYKKDGQTGFRLINKYPNMPFETDPLVVVDGIPVMEDDKVLMISSDELEKIDILNTRYFYSDIKIEGIINVTSKKGDLGVMEFSRPPFRQEFDALQVVDGQYSPDYETRELRESRIPDFRNTLFWNPDVTTDREGRAGITFHTSDEAAEYTVIIEGLSPDGKSARQISGFRVIPQE